MAKAEKIPQENFDVSLTLTHEEAQIVRDICGSVIGYSHHRELTARVFNSLVGLLPKEKYHFQDIYAIDD